MKLPLYHQLTFVYFLSKRQLPNYIVFNKKENWGNPNLLNETIDLLEKIIVSQSDFDKETNDIKEKLEKVTPDTDDFVGFLTSLALDACATLLEGLAFLKDKDNAHIQDICNSSLDLVQMYIEYMDNADFDDYCFNDQLFIEELNFQLNLVKLLEKQQVIDEIFLTETQISKSKLGELIRRTTLERSVITTITDINRDVDIPVQFDDEIQEWIKKDNINISELIPELLSNGKLISNN